MGDSTITAVQKPIETVIVRPNPFRSRSTIISLAVLASFLSLSGMVIKAGYFTAEYAMSSFTFLLALASKLMDHQSRSDSDKGTEIK